MSMADPAITVEVVYLSAEQQILCRTEIANGSTVIQAIDASGIIELLPDGAMDLRQLGVFSQKAAPDQLLRDGDRVEIYRPLQLDPMEARRRRAR
jgi:putative ubiquitin-RnfH superfamily antitoxin RatB of RatAB toxin-antitoxin module